MKFKRIELAVTVAALGLILTGCGGNSNQSNSQSKQSTTSVSKKSDSNKDKQSNALWDSKKDEKLKDFINEWAPTMHQNYDKYNGKKSIETSTGFSYPDDFSKVTVEGTHDSIGYSKDGTGKYAYNVVAIYNYVGTQPPLPSHITYFFAFHNGKPVALVDQSRDGTPNLHETANTDVKSTFAEIADGDNTSYAKGNNSSNDASSNSNSRPKTSSKAKTQLLTDPKSVGIMAYQEDFPTYDIYGDGAKYLHFGKNPDEGYHGEYGIASGGSGITVMQFTIDGDVVHCWRLDPDSAEIQADETMKETTYSLETLREKYYPTEAKRQEIQRLASSMNQSSDWP